VIEKRYRRDYDGEFVITNTDIRLGIKKQQREWIPNPIINQHLSGRAAVIGSSADREQFNYTKLQRHRGGLQGKKRLQTYSTGSIWQDMQLDFYCSTDRVNLTKLHNANYHAKTTVYASSRYCLMFPGSFYLIPFQPNMSDLATAIYLAAFDGHNEIYLVGYNQDTPHDSKNWRQQITNIMQSYSTHEFVLVGSAANMPGEWRELSNVQCWDYRKFVSYCDI